MRVLVVEDEEPIANAIERGLIKIGYAVDAKRQGIVDSWPEDVDDTAARHDWGTG